MGRSLGIEISGEVRANQLHVEGTKVGTITPPDEADRQ